MPPDDTAGISENVSEKRKRGRPRVISDADRALYAAFGLTTEYRTERGRQNIHYRQRAMSLLGPASEDSASPCPWLYDHRAVKRGHEGGRPPAWRPSILAELGRIEDDELLLAVARKICELKPGSHEAVAIIRRFRLGKSGEGDSSDLNGELTRAVNDYLRRYPDTPWGEVIDAIKGLLGSVEKSAG